MSQITAQDISSKIIAAANAAGMQVPAGRVHISGGTQVIVYSAEMANGRYVDPIAIVNVAFMGIEHITPGKGGVVGSRDVYTTDKGIEKMIQKICRLMVAAQSELNDGYAAAVDVTFGMPGQKAIEVTFPDGARVKIALVADPNGKNYVTAYQVDPNVEISVAGRLAHEAEPPTPPTEGFTAQAIADRIVQEAYKPYNVRIQGRVNVDPQRGKIEVFGGQVKDGCYTQVVAILKVEPDKVICDTIGGTVYYTGEPGIETMVQELAGAIRWFPWRDG